MAMKKRKLKKIEKENLRRSQNAARAQAYKSRRVPVDKAKLKMGNSYASPPDHYEDLPFVCVDCGAEEIWLAEQQKWWYEEIGGYFFSTAVRCRTCRKKEKKRHAAARGRDGENLSD